MIAAEAGSGNGADCLSLVASLSGPDRYRLWSLWDMQRFRAVSFAAALSRIQDAIVSISTRPGDDAADRAFIKAAVVNSNPDFAELPLSRVLQFQIKRLNDAVESRSIGDLVTLMRELIQNIIVELSSAWFLMISDDLREYYEQRDPIFGRAVAQKFPEASSDIAAAGRCLALDEWTACVFHLMRALEHGLRKMAEEVGLPPEGMVYENWRNVIDQMENKIRAIEKESKSPEKVIRLQILSEAAAQFRYFKDAWRNHVSHSRISYDQHTAMPVWLHVKMFVQHLANS
jgi:hypothetical protein